MVPVEDPDTVGGAAVEGIPSGKAATIRERLALAKLARGHHPSLRPLCDVSLSTTRDRPSAGCWARRQLIRIRDSD